MAAPPPLVLEFLNHATTVLNPATDQSLRRASDLWLAAFQLSSEAWAVVDATLRAPNLPENVWFLAAQTFNRKIRYDAEQLRGDW